MIENLNVDGRFINRAGPQENPGGVNETSLMQQPPPPPAYSPPHSYLNIDSVVYSEDPSLVESNHGNNGLSESNDYTKPCDEHQYQHLRR